MLNSARPFTFDFLPYKELKLLVVKSDNITQQNVTVKQQSQVAQASGCTHLIGARGWPTCAKCQIANWMDLKQMFMKFAPPSLGFKQSSER